MGSPDTFATLRANDLLRKPRRSLHRI